MSRNYLTSAFTLLLVIMAADADQALIDTTCKNTPYQQLCLATLKEDPGSLTADVAGLALIVVNAVKAKSTAMMDNINKLKKGRPGLGAALDTCSNAHQLGVLEADVPEAVEALKKGNPKFAEDGMADAAVEADACRDSLKQNIPPLNEINQSVHDLSVVARAVIRNLL